MRGLNGNEAAQPRVFAHDMVPVAIGAINPRQQGTGALYDEIYNGLEMTSGGAGHAVNDVITLSAGSGTVAAKVKVLSVEAPNVETKNNDLANAITTNQTDFVNGTYTGTVGVTSGYSTSGSGTGLIITVTVAGNTVTKINVDTTGASFTVGDTITVTGSGGVLGGTTGNLVITLGTGNITSFALEFSGTANAPYGAGYALADALTQAATDGSGTGFTATVRNIDLPNTHERGCCLYAGIAIDTGLDLVLESGELYNTTYTARLKGITAGSFLPVLAKRVVAVTLSSGSYASGDLVAIY